MSQRFCRSCGRPLEEGDKFCTQCGTPVPADDASASPGAAGTGTTAKMPVVQPAPEPAPTRPSAAVPPVTGGRAPAPAPAPAPAAGQNRGLIIACSAAVVIALIAVFVALQPWRVDAASSSSTSASVSASASTSAASASSASSTTSSASQSSSSSTSSSSSRTYTLSTVTTDGEKLSGTVHRNADDEVIPDITTTYYTRDQLLSYIQSDADLDVALNEAYAHAGRHFKNSALNAYFHSCSWYVDRGYADVELTGASKHNADLIAQIINDRGSSFKWMDIVLY